MDDVISRQAAIDAIHGAIFDFFDICDDDEESPMTYKDEQLLEINKAISGRIKQLPSAQPECEDAVSRFEVLRLIDYSSHDLNDAVDNRYMQNEIKQLPSVTPKQQGWIPCSTALPEYDGEYLVTKKSFGWNCKEYIETDIARYEKKDGWHKADTVLAWCELPTPYREGGQDE